MRMAHRPVLLAMLTHHDASRINVVTTRSQENRERVENPDVSVSVTDFSFLEI
jgi:hypothetical protein